MKPFRHYLTAFEDMPIDDAFNLLYDLGFIDEGILIWNETEHKLVGTTPWELIIGTQNVVFADEIGPIQFSGGPPEKLFWVTGTLLTMCIDKLLYRDAVKERIGTKNAVSRNAVSRNAVYNESGC